MKNLILSLLLVFSALLTNAQTFTYKIEPYSFEDGLTKKNFRVVGIRARMISNIDCNLSDSTFFRAFYIDFEVLDKGSYGALYTDTDKMSDDLAASKNIPLSAAKATIKEICRKLEYGTIEEKYLAATQLAAGYRYTLRSLAEQQ